MRSPPSAHGTRPFRNGRVSIQDGEEIGIVDWTLNAAPIRKLYTKTVKPISRDTQSVKNDTNRGVFEVSGHNTHSARRDLSERRVAEPELLD
jgi:hypothetical protein